MNVIVAGQRIVTRTELIEAALGFDNDPVEPMEFDSAMRPGRPARHRRHPGGGGRDRGRRRGRRVLPGPARCPGPGLPRRSALGFERGVA